MNSASDPTGPVDPSSPVDPSDSTDSADLAPAFDLGEDPALATAVLEIESHRSGAGWDQPAQLYALVGTASLVEKEPALAANLGLDRSSEEGGLVAIEQDSLTDELEASLASISWPDSVTGCAAVVERLVLPPDVDGLVPDGWEAAQEFARSHPDRQEVRITAAVTRAGARYCALRLRAHDDDESVLVGTDLVPGLLDLLAATLRDDTLVPTGEESDV
ncbi:MAG: PPA1309 family protein [Nocardioides sp.]